MAATPEPAAPDATPGRRRFRASDLAVHLDMAVIGEVCLGVTLAGYQSVLRGFLDDRDIAALPTRAHAVKGGAASLGLRALQQLAARLESPVEGALAPDGPATAQALRELIATARALLQRMGLL
ncbi:MAG: hypothetical protein CFE45_20670 [Burkholderiales bacterium PBB5]|nr:MAG: hypothetical protein CFE45_20670 [Burkholderiales bacterium PBB5]